MRRWATVSIPPEHIGDRVPTNVVLECLHISLGHRVCQPLYLLRCAVVAKPLLDTLTIISRIFSSEIAAVVAT